MLYCWIFKVPVSTAPQGTLQRKQHDSGSGDFMLPPDDGCVGLGASKVGTSQWYNDVYVADDYDVNKCLLGYKGGECTGRHGYYQPAPSATSGNPGGDGQTGVGPGYGQTQFTSVAKVVLISNFPQHGNMGPGGVGVPFWGTNFDGYFTDGSNVDHMDGHAQYYKTAKLLPPPDNSGDAPKGLSADETKAAVAAFPPQQQIDYINRSPIPQAEKDKKIADFKAKAGIK